MKPSKIILPLVAALALAACGSLSKVTKEGTTDNPIWPDAEKTTLRHSGTQNGTWPNWDNVRTIEAGMNIDQIYELIGRPHFNEGLYGVREWNYVFHYREAGEIKTCQYKILFDKHMSAQTFHWLPEGCAPRPQEPQREVIIREVVASPKPIRQ